MDDKKKVLVVEDYDDTREFMRFLLESYGYQVLEAANGYEALDKVKNDSPDLIFMDISMPVMDGLTAAKTIRERFRSKRVPIIAISAHGDSFAKKAKESGCDLLLKKPLDFEELRPVLTRYLPA